MVKARRVTQKDIAKAGGGIQLIAQLVETIRSSSSMEQREQSVMLIKSLTEQASLLEDKRENTELIADAGGIVPLVNLTADGSSEAKAFALSALANIALGQPQYQKAIVAADGIVRIASCLKTGDAHVCGIVAHR